MGVVKAFLFNMNRVIQNIFKFKKLFLLVVLTYIALYITYSVAIIASKVDIYFVIIFAFFLIALYWLIVGILSPKYLPFFKSIKSRLLVLLCGFLTLLSLMGLVISIELYIFNRDPLNITYKNVYYIYHELIKIHPFKGDAFTRYTEENDELNNIK